MQSLERGKLFRAGVARYENLEDGSGQTEISHDEIRKEHMTYEILPHSRTLPSALGRSWTRSTRLTTSKTFFNPPS
jgi:hypothetical protein